MKRMTAAGRKLYVPWKRFWCRFGDAVHIGTNGFLTDPDDDFTRLYNPHLRTLDQLLSEPCLVLCGDPGIGKTTELQQARPLVESKVQEGDHLIWLEFRDVPNEPVFARRTFDSKAWQTWRGSSGRLVLVVDGVDEGLVKIPDFVSYLTGQLRTEPVERLQVVLACRSADWPVAAGSELVALWGAKEKAPVFRLCPLRQDDAELAAQTKGLNPRSFIEAVYQNQVGGMAALPTTLFFLIEEFRDAGTFTGTHRDLFERGCLRLSREQDPRRLEALRALRKTAQVFTPQEINDAAGRLAALLMLCGKSAIQVGPIGDADAGADLHVSEAADTIGTGHRPALTEASLLDAIGTGLFTSRGPNRFAFAHQTFAECLAARFLAPLPLIQIRSLLCARDGSEEHVIPQLAETAAWVAGMREEFFDHLCLTEPETLLRSDVARVRSQRKAELVAAILDRAKRADFFDDEHNTRFLASLRHPGIADQLAGYITDRNLNFLVRRLALKIAAQCQLAELTDTLFRVVRETTDDQHIRERAARALVDSIQEERLRELIPLAKGEAEPDPDDTIRGCALQRLIPSVWSVAEAVPLLRAPRNQYLLGSYQVLLKYHLPRELTESDLPSLLGRLIRWTRCFHSLSPFEELADAAFTKALQRLDSEHIRRVVVRMWLVKQRRHHPLPDRTDSKVITLLEQREGLRRGFLEAVLNDPATREDDVRFLRGSFPHLLLANDFPWLLDRILTVAAERRAAWAEAIATLTCPETTAPCWDLFLERLETVPELTPKFTWLRAWAPDEPGARKAKAEWLKQERLRMRLHEKERGPDVEELLKQELELIAVGKTFVWIDLCHHLSVNEGDARIMVPLKHDLTEFPGWERASPERREQIVAAARQFLLKHSDGYAELGSRTNFSDPGYIAVWLLRDRIREDPELRAAVAANWVDALVGNFNDDSDHCRVSAALAYELNPDATLRGFIRELKSDDDRHGQILSLRGFSEAWDARFTATALELAKSGSLKHGSIESILGYVAQVAPAEAADCAQHLLSAEAIADPSLRDRTVAVLSACLGTLASETWDFTWPILSANDALGTAVLLRVASGHSEYEKATLPALSERQLAELFLRVRTLFSLSTDPKWGAGFGSVTPRMSVSDLRRHLATALEARGTEAACRELLRLANTLPEESISLRWRYHAARTSKRRKAWVPPPPRTVLELVARGEARLVRNTDDLLEVVLESLGRLQLQLTRNTLPRSEELWHWDGADTKRRNFRQKDEAFLSDYVARWLHDDLLNRSVVIGREVQPRRGQRTDIYVAAMASATGVPPADQVTVVIEVKGCWHPEVRQAAETQLVRDYLRLNGLSHGIYLVGWFVCPQWANLKNELKSQTLEEAHREVAELVAPFDGRTNPERVRAFVLDCRYPAASTRG